MNIIDCILQIPTKSEANCRDHWAVKAKRVKTQRKETFLTCRQEFGIVQIPKDSKITVELMRVATRKVDSDNLQSSLKAARDGVADYLQIDDGSGRINWVYSQQYLAKT